MLTARAVDKSAPRAAWWLITAAKNQLEPMVGVSKLWLELENGRLCLLSGFRLNALKIGF